MNHTQNTLPTQFSLCTYSPCGCGTFKVGAESMCTYTCSVEIQKFGAAQS